jgi:predicted unusual protein kinase regulating ubiquinone biosynthesis (AarF/ABC1/UbiB family)/SAM-dependent methyltransferase
MNERPPHPALAEHPGAVHGIEAQPDDEYFDVMASVAETHWWYESRRRLVAELLADRIRPDALALDVGCGTSETLDVLEALGARAAIGTDLSEHALHHAIRRQPRPRVLRALAEHLPFADRSVGALVSMDVIEHVDDDVVALQEYVRVCEPGAPVLITVPAYEWLWSDHDERAAHRRRYTAARLEEAAREAGLVVERCSYYFSFLLPPAALLRRTPLRRFSPPTDEEASSMGPVLDRVLGALGAAERRALRSVDLPAGLSIVLLARAPGGDAAARARRGDQGRHRGRSGGLRRAPGTGRAGDRVEGWRRQARVARLTARRGAHLAAVKVRGARLDDERRAELESQFVVHSAEDVARELGQMKGAVMKLGQMLGFAADALPPEAQAALAQLHQDVPPMAPSLAEQVVLEELGSPARELFLDWDPVPVAAASIGQVHRAVMPDGRVVAVKVQYPGVDRAIAHDLDHADRLYALAAGVALPGLDTHALIDELRARMADELDYRHEALAQDAFAARYEGHPFVHVPGVVPERSSRRILTSEWVDGLTFDEFRATATPEVQQRAAEVLFRFVQGSLHEHRVFNADPHPGNYRFHPDGTVTFLDFGLVKSFAPGEWEALSPAIDHVLAHDAEGVTAAMEAAGFLHAGHGLDPDKVFEVVSAPYRAYLTDEYTFTRRYVADALATLLDVRGPNAAVIAALDMPPSFVLLDRVVWGMSAMLGRLEARNRWRAILQEYRHGAPPATALGRAEAAWRAERPA